MNFKNFLKQVKFHGGIVLKGFIRMVYGALVAGLLACAVYGFISINSESGYAAVCDFIAATATLVVVILNVYIMGGKKVAKK